MDKPRLAIEFETKNDFNEWKRTYTKYYDIENKEEIIKAIKGENEYIRISKLYYANNYGIEIEWKEEKIIM